MRDGVFFVPLADVTYGDDIAPAVGRVVLRSDEAAPLHQRIGQLADRELLVVLDNLEQIADAAVVVHELLSGTRAVAVIATSRRPLHVQGEHEYPVAPLALPATISQRDVRSSAAVQLFCDQARTVRPRFALTTENATVIAAICARLDGLPLAIELAARGTRLLSPAALHKRLASVLGLRDPVVGRPGRHTSLRDTIAWSYGLLGQEARRSSSGRRTARAE